MEILLVGPEKSTLEFLDLSLKDCGAQTSCCGEASGIPDHKAYLPDCAVIALIPHNGRKKLEPYWAVRHRLRRQIPIFVIGDTGLVSGSPRRPNRKITFLETGSGIIDQLIERINAFFDPARPDTLKPP